MRHQPKVFMAGWLMSFRGRKAEFILTWQMTFYYSFKNAWKLSKWSGKTYVRTIIRDTSSCKCVPSKVPQESILDPITFLIFVYLKVWESILCEFICWWCYERNCKCWFLHGFAKKKLDIYVCGGSTGKWKLMLRKVTSWRGGKMKRDANTCWEVKT